jgi:hypothetical protein
MRWRMNAKNKYNAKRTIVDGITFDSKKEARYYSELLLRRRAGEITFFLRQVPFDLPGGIKYRVDFVEFCADGTIRFIDVKGVQTKEFILKKRMVEHLYPVQIMIVS